MEDVQSRPGTRGMNDAFTEIDADAVVPSPS
jgi:hypothetical protein